jgi:hypothetical protein
VSRLCQAGALPGQSPALAVRLGAQRGLFALHLVAAEVTVDRRWPRPPRITVSRSPHRAHLIRLALTAISPFQAVTQVFYNTCVTAVKRPFLPEGRVDRGCGGALAAPPRAGNTDHPQN